jgi:hypothetical protein
MGQVTQGLFQRCTKSIQQSGQNPEIKEYFIAGVNYCINVLAWEKPDVEASTR